MENCVFYFILMTTENYATLFYLFHTVQCKRNQKLQKCIA